jgi:murein L,D-transpeptidase YafK
MRRILASLAIPLAAAGLSVLPPSVFPAGAQNADGEAQVARVRVEKAARRVILLDDNGQPLRIFNGIQLGPSPIGPKHFEGDGRTPEGHYTIDRGNAQSAYHLSLHISYPDAADRAYAAAAGRAPGGLIFLHGQPNGYGPARAPGDWTEGCIAVTNSEIEEIWSRVGDGTPIDLVP